MTHGPLKEQDQEKILKLFSDDRLFSDDSDHHHHDPYDHHDYDQWQQTTKEKTFFNLVNDQQTDTLEWLFYLSSKNEINFDFNCYVSDNGRCISHHAIHMVINSKSLPMLHFLCTAPWDQIYIPDDAILHCVNLDWKEGLRYLYRFAQVENDKCYKSKYHRFIVGSKTTKHFSECQINKMFPPGITPLIVRVPKKKTHVRAYTCVKPFWCFVRAGKFFGFTQIFTQRYF